MDIKKRPTSNVGQESLLQELILDSGVDFSWRVRIDLRCDTDVPLNSYSNGLPNPYLEFG